jgi:hypothetical protein
MKRVKSIGAVALAMGLAALWAGSVQAQLTKIHVGYSALEDILIVGMRGRELMMMGLAVCMHLRP